MLGFLARRLLYLVPVLVAVSMLTFLIASLLPGDLAYVILGDQATPEKVAALRRDMGLDQPIWWRYISWLGHVLEGDFGRSFRTGQTVLQAVAERLPVSFELMLLAELGALVIGIPLAIACAVCSGSAFDRFMTGSAFGMLSVPTFLSAILLIYLFAVELRWLPATGYMPFEEDVIGNLRFFALPALTHTEIVEIFRDLPRQSANAIVTNPTATGILGNNPLRRRRSRIPGDLHL
jgi:peptide/nickel transport system permease protein